MSSSISSSFILEFPLGGALSTTMVSPLVRVHLVDAASGYRWGKAAGQQCVFNENKEQTKTLLFFNQFCWICFSLEISCRKHILQPEWWTQSLSCEDGVAYLRKQEPGKEQRPPKGLTLLLPWFSWSSFAVPQEIRRFPKTRRNYLAFLRVCSYENGDRSAPWLADSGQSSFVRAFCTLPKRRGIQRELPPWDEVPIWVKRLHPEETYPNCSKSCKRWFVFCRSFFV